MRKFVVIAALLVLGTSFVGCKASGEIDSQTSIAMPR